jgi:hypothetical protein
VNLQTGEERTRGVGWQANLAGTLDHSLYVMDMEKNK